jgi:ABC-type uncharacterized transport system fused permease/ATPase subunit
MEQSNINASKARLDGKFLNGVYFLGGHGLGSPLHWKFYIFVILILLSIAELFLGNQTGAISSQFIGVFIDGPNTKFSLKPLLDVLWVSLCLIFLSAIFKTAREVSEDTIVTIWRHRLTSLFQKAYFTNNTYYNLVYGKKVDNTDQRITRDIEAFTKLIGPLISKIVIIPLTIIYYTWTTFRGLGWQGPAMCYAYFILGTILNRIFINWVIPFWYKQELYEGDFRYSHMTIRANAESIAFYSGQEWELQENTNQLNRVIDNRWAIIRKNSILKFHMSLFGYLGAFFNYFVLGFSIYLLKVFRGSDMTPGQYASSLLYASFQCLMLIYGFTQLIQIGGDVSELAGHSSRLTEMYSEMKQFKGKTENETVMENDFDFIEMENVNITSPEGDTIVSDVSFKINEGENLLIAGPSGSGKSSILRVLNGIWKSKGGIIRKPSDVYYVPQQTYTKNGTLYEQITYPTFDTLETHTLKELLELVKLEYLLGKAGQVIGWDQLLSPGEKQRLALARLFYKNPKFAVMDESTSAIDVDIEEHVYMECEKRKITLISVGHRPTLVKYHRNILKLSGDGKWEIKV